MAAEFLINQSDVIYAIMNGFTTDVSGSWFLTNLLLVMFIVLLAIALRIPIEFTAIIVVPLLIVLMAWEGDYVGVGGVFLLYIGVLVGKNFLI